MSSWVRVTASAVRDQVGMGPDTSSSCMFSAVQSFLCEGQRSAVLWRCLSCVKAKEARSFDVVFLVWRPKKRGPLTLSFLCEGQRSAVLWRCLCCVKAKEARSFGWPTASVSLSQPKLLPRAVTAPAIPLQTSLMLCLQNCFFFFCLNVWSDMWVYRHSAGQSKCHTWPVVTRKPLITCQPKAFAQHHTVQTPSASMWHGIVHETQLGCTSAFTRTTATWTFSHFPRSTATVLAWKPGQRRTESTTNEMFVSLSTVKCSSSSPLNKSMTRFPISPSEHPNVCELPFIPIKLTERLGIA